MSLPAYLAIGAVAVAWLAVEVLSWYRAERRHQ
jgi:predicted DNA-binding transcriptional regulator AlpA